MNEISNEESQYERYSIIFEKIRGRCNQANFQGVVSDSLGSEYEHYYVDGLHVYQVRGGEQIEISEDEMYVEEEKSEPDPDIKLLRLIHPIITEAKKDKEIKKSKTEEEVKMSIRFNRNSCKFLMLPNTNISVFIGIFYERICERYDDIEKDDIGDRYYLPDNVWPKTWSIWNENNDTVYSRDPSGHLTEDMQTVLRKAIENAADAMTKKLYERALKFHDRVYRVANERDMKAELRVNPQTTGDTFPSVEGKKAQGIDR